MRPRGRFRAPRFRRTAGGIWTPASNASLISIHAAAPAYLTLQSNYLNDASFDAASTSAWSYDSNYVACSKVTAPVKSGARCMQVVTTADDAAVTQDPGMTNMYYWQSYSAVTVSVWVKGSGGGRPYLKIGGAYAFGTTSTEWQQISWSGNWQTDTAIRLYNGYMGSAYWDDLQVSLARGPDVVSWAPAWGAGTWAQSLQVARPSYVAGSGIRFGSSTGLTHSVPSMLTPLHNPGAAGCTLAMKFSMANLTDGSRYLFDSGNFGAVTQGAQIKSNAATATAYVRNGAGNIVARSKTSALKTSALKLLSRMYYASASDRDFFLTVDGVDDTHVTPSGTPSAASALRGQLGGDPTSNLGANFTLDRLYLYSSKITAAEAAMVDALVDEELAA